jgi:hypothetical protein
MTETVLSKLRARFTPTTPHPRAKYRPAASVRATAPAPRVHRCPCADCRDNAR